MTLINGLLDIKQLVVVELSNLGVQTDEGLQEASSILLLLRHTLFELDQVCRNVFIKLLED
jgi:hypothetical protein